MQLVVSSSPYLKILLGIRAATARRHASGKSARTLVGIRGLPKLDPSITQQTTSSLERMGERNPAAACTSSFYEGTHTVRHANKDLAQCAAAD